jgi:hypothetical protein
LIWQDCQLNPLPPTETIPGLQRVPRCARRGKDGWLELLEYHWRDQYEDYASKLKHKTTMKTPVAVTLILMGSVLVMTPAVSDSLFQRNLVDLLSALAGRTGSVSLDGKMGDLYRIGCGLTGSAMIGVAVSCAFFARKAAPEHKGAAEEDEDHDLAP